MKATMGTMWGTKSVDIKSADVKFSPKEEEKMINKFNRDTRALEFVGGTTYCVDYTDPKGIFRSYRRLKSSSLDELLEMYKCAWKGKDVPVRKCFFHPNGQPKK
jgi:hypothetical protein